MNKVEKSNDVASNDTISKPLEISRHGDSHIGETLEEAAGNYQSIIRTISPQWESEIEMAFKAGAQWQKEQIIDKAFKYINYQLNLPSDFEQHFRKAMEK